jgi:hypothetical protein
MVRITGLETRMTGLAARLGGLAVLAATMAVPHVAAAQGNAATAANPAPGARGDGAIDRAREIAGQPARDVGAARVTIPPVLAQAIANPYGPANTRSCAALAAGLRGLNAVLGPDFVAGADTNENRASKIAEAGGKTIVNSLIPFRGLVREMTGAAPAQRRLNAAIDAGYARRGFLQGLRQARKCRG